LAEGSAIGLPLDEWSRLVKPTSYEVMKMKAVNHKPMIYPKGTLVLQGEEEVSLLKRYKY